MSAVVQTIPRISVRVDADLWTPSLTPEAWRRATEHGDTWTVFQELHWLRSWWNTYRRGELLIVSAYSDRSMIAIAPLFVDGGMAFFVGSGGSDYLDFIGDSAATGVMEVILESVLERVPGLLGFRFYHVPDTSNTGCRLREAVAALNLDCVDEGGATLVLDLGPGGEDGIAVTHRKSLVRHERAFHRTGTLPSLRARNTHAMASGKRWRRPTPPTAKPTDPACATA